MTYSKEIARELILDHLENPRQMVKKDYPHDTLKNPACGDVITVYVLVENKKIIDLTYQVDGCSITKAAASMISEILIGKTLAEVKKINNNFSQMLIGEQFDQELLGQLNSFYGVKDTPPRIKCATLPLKATLKVIGDLND